MAVKLIVIPSLGSVKLQKRKGNRSMRLSIHADGTIRVSLPHWATYASAEKFVREKEDWILQRRIKPTLLQHKTPVGKAHHLLFIPGHSKVTTRTIGNEIRVFFPLSLSLDAPEVQKAARKASEKALTLQAESLLPSRLQSLASAHGFEYRSLRVRTLKSRWGSCSSQKDITLNCYLMQLPWKYIDYVLLHELTHTKIMAHGKPFWQELGKYVTGLAETRKHMRQVRPTFS